MAVSNAMLVSVTQHTMTGSLKRDMLRQQQYRCRNQIQSPRGITAVIRSHPCTMVLIGSVQSQRLGLAASPLRSQQQASREAGSSGGGNRAAKVVAHVSNAASSTEQGVQHIVEPYVALAAQNLVQ